jgi:hypothetical protein
MGRGSLFSAVPLDDLCLILGRGNDRIFSLRHCVQTGSGAQQTYYLRGTGSTFPEGKEVGT